MVLSSQVWCVVRGVFLSFCLSVCRLSVCAWCLSVICLSVPSACLSFCLSVCLSVYLSVCLSSVFLSSVFLSSVFLSSVFLSSFFCLSVCQSVCRRRILVACLSLSCLVLFFSFSGARFSPSRAYTVHVPMRGFRVCIYRFFCQRRHVMGWKEVKGWKGRG